MSSSGVRQTLRTVLTSANVASDIQDQLLRIRDENMRHHRRKDPANRVVGDPFIGAGMPTAALSSNQAENDSGVQS